MREHSLEFLNPFLPIHSIYLVGLVDFLVMLGCSLLLQDHLCRAPLLEECPQHHGHKGDLRVTPGTWRHL